MKVNYCNSLCSQQKIQVLARHYGTLAEDDFQGHRTEANPVFSEFIIQEFDKFKMQMFMMK
ncbi:hypothetical protein DPMN_124774 [Dreissena polymorpha]|uniref:Uncharacterized protein n=1 Tax=Dreissena polymorpha TaxID=45954 RepID=A0A9D4JSH0_DREPO|nr:hypothetical protein DPMN_124774 [Dreissena polymorpha]